MKVQLIEDWRAAWRLWSVRYAVALAALPELLYQIAQALGQVLPQLPAVALDYLPPWLRAACAVLSLIAVALRMLRQPAAPCAPASADPRTASESGDSASNADSHSMKFDGRSGITYCIRCGELAPGTKRSCAERRALSP